MKMGMIILAAMALAAGAPTPAPSATSEVAVATESTNRTWTRNAEKLAGARFYRYGGEKYPHEVWLESRMKAGDQPIRIRLPLDTLSDDDIEFLRKNHPDGFPPDYQRKSRKSEPATAPYSDPAARSPQR
jgi:hypothetical protein